MNNSAGVQLKDSGVRPAGAAKTNQRRQILSARRMTLRLAAARISPVRRPSSHRHLAQPARRRSSESAGPPLPIKVPGPSTGPTGHNLRPPAKLSPVPGNPSIPAVGAAKRSHLQEQKPVRPAHRRSSANPRRQPSGFWIYDLSRGWVPPSQTADLERGPKRWTPSGRAIAVADQTLGRRSAGLNAYAFAKDRPLPAALPNVVRPALVVWCDDATRAAIRTKQIAGGP